MNINKSNFSGHNCERFFVKIFGAIEYILSAGTDDDCPVKYFCNLGKNWKYLSWLDHHIRT